jgi:hypothetical protein
MLASNREFVATHPVATKRVVRAILKATDLCANEPARAAQRLAERGLTARYDYALQTLSEKRLQMAGIRRRRHDPVLCFAPPRRRPDQVEPAENHRRWHGLAFPRRAQTRAKDVSTEFQA